jgi:hypothetical protein
VWPEGVAVEPEVPPCGPLHSRTRAPPRNPRSLRRLQPTIGCGKNGRQLTGVKGVGKGRAGGGGHVRDVAQRVAGTPGGGLTLNQRGLPQAPVVPVRHANARTTHENYTVIGMTSTCMSGWRPNAAASGPQGGVGGGGEGRPRQDAGSYTASQAQAPLTHRVFPMRSFVRLSIGDGREDLSVSRRVGCRRNCDRVSEKPSAGLSCSIDAGDPLVG